MATLSVAVVGSGPAGLYTAEALLKQAAALDPPCQVAVDVIDRLPTPYGLVRYGVAPDHAKIKSITDVPAQGARDRRRPLPRQGRRRQRRHEGGAAEHYDAVVYAYGAMRRPAARHRRRGAARQLLRDRLRRLVQRPPRHRSTRSPSTPRWSWSAWATSRSTWPASSSKTADDLRPTDVPEHVLEVLDGQPGQRHPRDRPARARAGQVHHQGAARARRADRRRHRGRCRRG